MIYNNVLERCVVMCWSLVGSLSFPSGEGGVTRLLFCSVPCGWEHDSSNVVLPVHSTQVGHVSQMLGVPFRTVDMKRGEYNTLGDFFMLRGKLVSYYLACPRSCIYFAGILVQF